jgi:PEP-CTERM motif-containing protein
MPSPASPIPRRAPMAVSMLHTNAALIGTLRPSQRFLSALGAVAMLALSPVASATPVSISDFSFAPGSGYGVDANEAAGTLLDVLFSSGFSAQSFILGVVGDSWTFDLGSIALREPNSHSGIVASETDGLDIAARLTFTDPFSSLIQLLVTGSATTGSVSDAAIDYVIDWNPVQVAFGSGGLIEISLSDMSFTGIETLTQAATVTLVRADESAPTAIPEPASLALLGLGIGCVALTRRRRSARSTTARFNDSVTNPAPAPLP